jgi:GDP-4-dehydro-6-deoxy-D-mannose reductase
MESVEKMQTINRILITGMTGFVGRHLVGACQRRYPQATIFGLARHEIRLSSSFKNTHTIVANISSYQDVRQVIAQVRPDVIFHLAAQTSVSLSWHDPVGTLQTNTQGLLNILEAVRAEKLMPRVLVVGAGDQYGFTTDTTSFVHENDAFRPLNPYAVSKAAQDFYAYLYFVMYRIPILRVRPFYLFGPYQQETSLIAKIASRIALIEAGKLEPVLYIKQLHAEKDYLPVQDGIAAYLAALERGRPGTAYNVGSGRVHTLKQVVQMLLQHTWVNIQVQEDGASSDHVERPLAAADISLLHTHTGWQPGMSMNIALQRTLDYWRAAVACSVGPVTDRL